MSDSVPAERWIVIPRWDGKDGFQHYTDRDPIWIKNYRTLLNDEDYLALSFVQRGILHGIWLEYAASNRQLRDSTVTLTRRLGQRVTRASLEALNHAGYIEFAASRPLALTRSRREETERETETDQKSSKKQKTSGRQAKSGDPLIDGIIAVLSQVTKPGFSEAKLTVARIADLIPRFDGLDLVFEAEKLRDWELYGVGAGKPTKDGVARFRSWLGKASRSDQPYDEDDANAPPLLPPGMTF